MGVYVGMAWRRSMYKSMCAEAVISARGRRVAGNAVIIMRRLTSVTTTMAEVGGDMAYDFKKHIGALDFKRCRKLFKK